MAQGTKSLTFYPSKDGWLQLRMLSGRLDRPAQDLLLDALDALFRDHGLPAIPGACRPRKTLSEHLRRGSGHDHGDAHAAAGVGEGRAMHWCVGQPAHPVDHDGGHALASSIRFTCVRPPSVADSGA